LALYTGTSFLITNVTKIKQNTVAYRPTDRQRPQHTRGQKYMSSVFCGPFTDRCYATHAKRILACAVTPHNRRSETGRCFLWFRAEAVFWAAWSVPCLRVYKGASLKEQEGRTKRMGIQRSTTGTRELELGVSREWVVIRHSSFVIQKWPIRKSEPSESLWKRRHTWSRKEWSES
jgi:hypothetical protein